MGGAAGGAAGGGGGGPGDMLDDLDGIDLQGLGLDDREGGSGEDSDGTTDGDGGELEWARRRAQMSQLDRDYEDGLDELAEEQVRKMHRRTDTA